MSSKDLILCKYVASAYGCNYNEMYTLVVAHVLSLILPVYYLILYLKNRKKTDKCKVDYFLSFWVFMIITVIFRIIITICPFHYTQLSYQIVWIGINQVLLFIYVSIVIYIIMDLLYQYQGITQTINKFFKLFFALYSITFISTAVVITVYSGLQGDRETYYLWHAATTIMILVFAMVPSFRLIKKMTYPVIQPGKLCCMRTSNFLIGLFIFLEVSRCIYDIIMFSPFDFITGWYAQFDKTGALPLIARWFIITKVLIFDISPSMVVCWIVNAIFSYDLGFQNDNFYSPQPLL
ncbi:hypothetical protein TVAG_430840 [Trichomonas vaginalis G3]|uniref:Serpentine receptor class gamma n=1 Tax=Trichomonas vaginalis (strain ATCC PRA-98 / G3) TaxID=412133 RepID=A2E3A7_TRIV3|nr:hypothetical protein TVAGG3_1017510 [Trichomonas vaginalis G3]EAY12917.1 hypothetical protein TVAG_430840 [Trichomonas vaginalis G3]KAI5491912.1 hypothetical protein TVAGG3_1017510 [Trichomonas vaginalis G3]|eukprot:XP_001325140.1 hypothetical protein [Trichomonas vaginalis G3]